MIGTLGQTASPQLNNIFTHKVKKDMKIRESGF